jgi:hypothetical protein
MFAVSLVAFMFLAVSAAFLIGGYARFRSRAANGHAVLAYTGLLIALAGATFFVFVAVSGLCGLLFHHSG